ncbi:MAG: aldehyde-activating protein [Caulobacteraceae bacterium]|nr:aldehyde-activating protein [Caulobacteraceae bacterium]
MAEDIEGGCRCGRVRYRATVDKLPNVYACHCLDCQTWSGSAFSAQFILPETQLEVTGEPQIYELTSPDGARTSYQRACPVCFTRVYNTNSARPGLAVVRAGTLDRSDELEVVAHIWTRRKMGGIVVPDDAPSWPEGAPPAEFVAILSR